MTLPDPEIENGPLRVLIVDDDPLLARSISRALGSGGRFQTTIANGANQAVDMLADADIDAVLTDINMPQGDGLALLRRLRGQRPDLPVVLQTGAPQLASAQAAVELGAYRYLIKPVPGSELASILQKACLAHRLAVWKRKALVTSQPGLAPASSQPLEGALRDALDGLWIAWQPIVRPETGRVTAYEALMRTTSSHLGNPAEILKAAERLGRLWEVGRRVREQVAAEIARARSGLRFFVNLHPADLLDDELISPTASLTRHASSVVLEVTERASIGQAVKTRRRIEILREFGYQIAVDDLGAGYAGLTSFASLDPDVVKLDGSLIAGIDGSATRRRLVAAMTSLCSDLGITVVAESVETLEEARTCSSLGCDLLQGYLFGRPQSGFQPPLRPEVTPSGRRSGQHPGE